MPDKEPLLMPSQDKPFNGDKFVCEEFLKLKEKFGISTAIELGSCVGGTTKWLGENFKKVITIEINETFRTFCLNRVKGLNNVESLLGDTVELLPEVLKNVDDKTIVFIDSHWNTHCPMLDELRIIAESGINPVIVIHDFKVPDKDFGFDSYNGQDFTFDWIESSLHRIYGIAFDKAQTPLFKYHYNDKAEGANRGVIYIYPKNI